MHVVIGILSLFSSKEKGKVSIDINSVAAVLPLLAAIEWIALNNLLYLILEIAIGDKALIDVTYKRVGFWFKFQYFLHSLFADRHGKS